MVRVLQNEAEILIKKVPSIKFNKSSIRKNRGGKTYHLSDDSPSMDILAEMRGYKDKVFIFKKNGEDIEKVYTAKQQCIDENIYM